MVKGERPKEHLLLSNPFAGIPSPSWERNVLVIWSPYKSRHPLWAPLGLSLNLGGDALNFSVIDVFLSLSFLSFFHPFPSFFFNSCCRLASFVSLLLLFVEAKVYHRAQDNQELALWTTLNFCCSSCFCLPGTGITGLHQPPRPISLLCFW